jgi:ABC-type nitrate/sulfonate/bicarbonate transport system permease component
MNSYETQKTRYWLRDAARLLKNSFGSLLSREFLTVFIPLLILWEVLPRCGVVPRTLVPTPVDVGAAFWDMLIHKGLALHFALSMGRFGLGMLLAIVLAIPIGVLMGWNVFIRKHSLPFFQLLSPVPPPAWVPMTIIVLGVGLPMQTFLIFLGAFYPILFNTYQAVKDTDPRYLASARVFGASELTLILHIYFWHSFGAIIMSIKTGIAMGLVMLIIAEMHGGRSGIGYLLVEAKEFFQIPNMAVCMIVLGFAGWFLIEILKFVELKLAVWKSGR